MDEGEHHPIVYILMDLMNFATNTFKWMTPFFINEFQINGRSDRMVECYDKINCKYIDTIDKFLSNKNSEAICPECKQNQDDLFDDMIDDPEHLYQCLNLNIHGNHKKCCKMFENFFDYYYYSRAITKDEFEKSFEEAIKTTPKATFQCALRVLQKYRILLHVCM